MQQTLIRSILKIGGGILVAKGLTDDSTAEVIVAGLAALIGIIWGILRARSQAQASKAQPVPITRVAPLLMLTAGLFLLAGCGSLAGPGRVFEPAATNLVPVVIDVPAITNVVDGTVTAPHTRTDLVEVVSYQVNPAVTTAIGAASTINTAIPTPATPWISGILALLGTGLGFVAGLIKRKEKPQPAPAPGPAPASA